MRLLRGFPYLIPILLLAGCTGLFEPWGESAGVADTAQPPIVSDRFLLTSDAQRVVGDLQIIETNFEDTFVDIARVYNLGFDELVQANPGVDPWLPGAGARVLLPTRFVLPDAPRDGIVINTANKRLFYFLEPDADGARAVLTFPIGIGRQGSSTPLGETTVTSKGRDPVWYPPASIRREYAAEGNPLPAKVMPGPDNPLGKFVLVLGMPSYLIHGTNRPAGVGMRVSHGCVRLFPENIEYLYSIAPVGVKVTIVNEPWQFAWHEGELYFEAHPPLDDDARDWPAQLTAMVDAARAEVENAAIDLFKVDAIAAATLGFPLAVGDNAPAIDSALARIVEVHNLVEIAADEPELAAADPEE